MERIQARTIQIGIYGEEEKLNQIYLDLLLNQRFDHDIKGYFAVDYESMNGDKDKGIVTITGSFSILEVCDVLSRNFTLISINERKLEDLSQEIISKLEKILGEKQGEKQ